MAMDYEVRLGDGERYVLIRVFVPMDSATGVRVGADAVRLGAEHSVEKFLFDLRASPNVQSIVDNYEFAHKEIGGFGFPLTSRSAFLVRPDDKSHDFINTAFYNAGYVTRLFADEAAAIAWLEAEAAPPGKMRSWRDDFL
jgi:hypothetical protein